MTAGTMTLLVLTVFVASLVLTWVVRCYALHAALLDVPNARSSHSVPTPRGGGLAIVMAVFAAHAWLWAEGVLDGRTAAALIGGGMAVAAVGWVDDRHSVSPGWRLAVQAVAALWAVAWLAGTPTAAPLGWLGAVVALIWLTNLYNFMDGIDGLAGMEAVTVAGGAAALLWSAGSPGLGAAAATLAAGAAGFLVWNWPPARIFMGDVGSGTVGFVFGVLALASSEISSISIGVWFVLLAVFVLDATFTLVRRIFEGERWYEAHRSHAYQRAVQNGATHQAISGTVGIFNVVILWPLAAICHRFPESRPWIYGCVVAGGFFIWRHMLRNWERRIEKNDTEQTGDADF